MSIIEVAKKAGVSQGTVSRVINGSHRVSDETTKVVKEAMDSIGYIPLPPNKRRGPKRTSLKINSNNNTVAVFLISKTPYTQFGMLVPLFQGIEKGLKDKNLGMTLGFIAPDEVPQYLHSSSTVGAIIIEGEPRGQLLSKLKNIPTIYISSRQTDSASFAMVGSDVIGRMAADYLIEKGHKSLAFLNPLGSHPGYSARGEGFMFTAFYNNCHINKFIDNSIAYEDIKTSTMEKLELITASLINKLVRSPELPSGLFIPCDRLTALAYRCFRKYNIDLGRDIKIISADNDEKYLAGLYPRPATIDIHNYDIGVHAVKDLLWEIHNPDENINVQTIIDPAVIEYEEE